MALKVLAEKANIQGTDLSALSPQERACTCFESAKAEFRKVFTLEFSRDRKSMSVYCKNKEDKPLMFVKVSRAL